MPASADIYGAIQQPRPINRLAELANVIQIQGMQQQGEMGRMKMDELRRERDQENALSAAYRDSLGADGRIDRNKFRAAAAAAGLGAKIPGLEKGWADQDKAATDADQAKFKLANERYGVFQKTMGALKDMPNLSKQMVMEAGANLVQQGILPKEMYDGAVANMPDDPAQLRQRLTQGLATQLPPEKVFELFAPKPTEVTNGQQKFFRDTNPNSPTFGQNVGGAPVQMQMTPGEVATDRRAGAQLQETQRHNEKMEGFRSTEVTTQQGKRLQDGAEGLRKEFNALPEVKNYKEVLPIMQSVRNAPDTPAGDIDLIYGVGKVMDPNSVVREGEMALVIKSGSPAQRLAGFYNYVKGGGRLTQAQRQELLTIMESRTAGLRANYSNARKTYETAADRQGLPKEQVFIEPNDAGAVVNLDKLPGGGKPSGGPKVVDFGSLK